jgi:hypothetical protein
MEPAQRETALSASSLWLIVLLGPTLIALCRYPENYFVCLFAAAAFRIIAPHFVASVSDSNPKTAEYFLPTTWATRKIHVDPRIGDSLRGFIAKARPVVALDEQSRDG